MPRSASPRLGGIVKALVAERTRQPGATALRTKPFGQSTSGSPDVLGPLRRARQMLAGTPTAIKPRVQRPGGM